MIDWAHCWWPGLTSLQWPLLATNDRETGPVRTTDACEQESVASVLDVCSVPVKKTGTDPLVVNWALRVPLAVAVGAVGLVAVAVAREVAAASTLMSSSGLTGSVGAVGVLSAADCDEAAEALAVRLVSVVGAC